MKGGPCRFLGSDDQGFDCTNAPTLHCDAWDKWIDDPEVSMNNEVHVFCLTHEFGEDNHG